MISREIECNFRTLDIESDRSHLACTLSRDSRNTIMEPYAALRLRHVVAFDAASTGLAGVLRKEAARTDCKGGRDLSRASNESGPRGPMEPAHPLLPVIQSLLVRAHAIAKSFAVSHPVTATQIGLGAGLYLARFLGLAGDSVLFHPASYGPSNLLSGPAAALILGLGLFESVRRAYALVSYGGRCEQILDGAEAARPRMPGSFPEQAKGLVDRLRGSTYLKLQSLTIVAIIAAEMAFSPSATLFRRSPAYPLSPILEYATMFHFSFLAPAHGTVTFVEPLPPLPAILLPWAYCATSFFTSIRECLVGMGAALVAAKLLGLKRSDGQPIVEWYAKELQYWAKVGTDLVTASLRAANGNNSGGFGGRGRRLGD